MGKIGKYYVPEMIVKNVIFLKLNVDSVADDVTSDGIDCSRFGSATQNARSLTV